MLLALPHFRHNVEKFVLVSFKDIVQQLFGRTQNVLAWVISSCELSMPLLASQAIFPKLMVFEKIF